MTETEILGKVHDVNVRVSDLAGRVDRLTERLDLKLDGVAREGWVHDIIKPIQQSIVRMEGAVSSLSEDAKELFDAHKTMLKQEGERKEREWHEKTPLGLAKKYLPVFSLLGALIMLYRVMGTVFEAWLTHKGYAPK